jgi:hypothetical protein
LAAVLALAWLAMDWLVPNRLAPLSDAAYVAQRLAVAEKSFNDAVNIAASRPEDFDYILAYFRSLAHSFRDTPYGAKALEQLDLWEGRRREAAVKKLEAARVFSGKQPMARVTDFDVIIAEYQQVIEQFANTPAAEEAGKFVQEWEAKKNAAGEIMLKAAKEYAAAKPTDLDGYLKRLVEVGQTYYGTPVGNTAWKEVPLIIGKRREAREQGVSSHNTDAESGQVPASWRARLESDEQKRARWLAAGGTPDVEDVVHGALNSLKKVQKTDGSWDRYFPVAMTSLASLAFLAHGETPSSARYGETVKRAIDFLKARLETGRVGDLPEYQAPMALTALAEAYGLTRDASLKPVLEQCVAQLLADQTARGGWGHKTEVSLPPELRVPGYQQSEVGSADISITSWHIQALQAAHAAGISRAAIAPALDRAVAYVKSLYSPRLKEFGYDRPTGGWTRCGLGVLPLQLWHATQDREVKDALHHARATIFFSIGKTKEEIDLETGEGLVGEDSPYAYYFLTQAAFLFDGPEGEIWKWWCRDYQRSLVRYLAVDGRFNLAETQETILPTAFGVLMLTAPYRLVPTVNPSASPKQ